MGDNARRHKKARTLQGGVGFTVIRSEIRERAREDRHRVRVIPGKQSNQSTLTHTSQTPRHTTDTRAWKERKRKKKHTPEGAEKVLCVRMHRAMRHDLVLELPQLRLAG